MSCNLILGMCQEPGSASLPCTTVAVGRVAGAKKDSMRFCAIPLWTTAGSFISHFVSESQWHQFVGGAQPPASSVQGGCSPPRPPASYASVIEYLIKVKHCNPKAHNIDGELPLHIACKEHTKLEIVKLLCDCDVNTQTLQSGDTPLHYACMHEYCAEVVKYLVEEKFANPSIQNNNWQLPLHIACSSGNISLRLVDCSVTVMLTLTVEHSQEIPHYMKSVK